MIRIRSKGDLKLKPLETLLISSSSLCSAFHESDNKGTSGERERGDAFNPKYNK